MIFSITVLTESTASFAKCSEALSALFPVIEVIAICIKVFVSSDFISSAILSRILKASSFASFKPLVITVECMFWSNKLSAFFNNSPAKTAAVVVPSPTSSSCVLATSTSIFAAGCSICISSRIVTPSFVITISPKLSTSILSIPLGPRVVLTASATAFAAAILLCWASFPKVLKVPSGNTRIGCPPIVALPFVILSPHNQHARKYVYVSIFKFNG